MGSIGVADVEKSAESLIAQQSAKLMAQRLYVYGFVG
jgi:hypothetical protein